MSPRPASRFDGHLVYGSISILMASLLLVLFMAACATDESSVPPDKTVTVVPTERVTVVPTERVTVEGRQRAEAVPAPADEGALASAKAREEDAFSGTEELVVVRSAPTSSVAAVSVSALALDAAAPMARRIQAPPPIDWNTERYDAIEEPGFVRPTDTPLSTFSVDVDTAAYANVRRFLRERTRPPRGAVRIEELVNYFRYPRRVSPGAAPFAVDMEIFDAPWRAEHRLVRIAIEGREMPLAEVPPRNLVFLLDVSGSMRGPDRLGLVKYGMSRLVETLRPIDRVSIVVYAGASGLLLPPTAGHEEEKIVAALERLEAGGSTAGGEGIRLAYQTAREHFDEAGINRVILATDGDFNVGVTSRSELLRLIEQERESGVELTVLGVGRGNLNDAVMEQLADHGNGNYGYIDGRAEARKVLVEQANATLVTIAKDVKIQVEFNPSRVQAYRLLGYENRRLADQDFNDDGKDAGEIGAGHTVTALYEIVPVEAEGGVAGGSVDALAYQAEREPTAAAGSGEWLTLKLRYKAPGGDESRLLSAVLAGQPAPVESASESARFSTAVALFGMLLRDSEWKGAGSYPLVERLAEGALGADLHGERREFLELVQLARTL